MPEREIPVNGSEIRNHEESDELAEKIASGYYREKTNPFEGLASEQRLDLAFGVIEKGGLYKLDLNHFSVFDLPEEQEKLAVKFAEYGYGPTMLDGLERGVFDKLNHNLVASLLIYYGDGSSMERQIREGRLVIDENELTRTFEELKGDSSIAMEYYNFLKLSADYFDPSDPGKNREGFEKALQGFLQTCGLDPGKTLEIWRDNFAYMDLTPVSPAGPVLTGYAGEIFQNFKANMNVMVAIEGRYSGGVKELYEKFGISAFGRYDWQVLLRQLENSNDDTSPYGVAIFPKSDYDGSFYSEFDINKDLLLSLEKQLAEQGYLVRIIESGKKTALYHRVVRLDREYNRSGNNKIKFVVLAGHGTPQDIRLGSRVTRDMADIRISQNDFFVMNQPVTREHAAFERFKQCFEADIDIVFHSCETAAEVEGEKNIAEVISESFETRVTGPKTPAAATNIYVKFENGKVRLEQHYAAARGIYYHGRKVE